MHILLLTQWFEPEPAFKGLSFAKALVQRGHSVEVLTGFPNYPEGRLYPGYRLHPWQVEWMDGIRVVRTFLVPGHDRSVAKRILNYGGFAVSAGLFGCTLLRRPDVIYVYHPPATIGLAAQILRKRFGSPFVYDIQDLWPDTLGATGMLGNKTALRAISKFCQGVYHSADRIAVLSPGFERILVQRGINASKIEVIYNWCDETIIRPMPEDARLKAALGLSGLFNVMFAGNLGAAQGLEAVLEAARCLHAKAPEIHFIFVGGGMGASELEARAAAMGLDNVRFLPRRPMAQIAAVLNLADVLLVHLKKNPLFEITIPSKTQAYMAVGRPILMGVAGDAADMVKKAGAGLVCEPENPAAIAEAVLCLFRMTAEKRHRMGENGRRFYRQQMSRDIGVERFEAIFEAVRKAA